MKTKNIEIAKVTDLQIDKSIVGLSLLAPLEASAKSALLAKVKAEGAREPLIVWGKSIVDGVERLEMYRELGITECPIVRVEFADVQAAALWRASHHIARRQLNLWQRCRIAVEMFILPNSVRRANGEGEKWTDAKELSGAALETLQHVEFILKTLHEKYATDKAKESLGQLEQEKKTIYRIYSDLKKLTNTNYGDNNDKEVQPINDRGALLLPKPRMPKSPEYINSVICADRLDGLSILPCNSVTMIPVSPPYLGANYDYDGVWNDGMTYANYLLFLRETFVEIHRVLREGGTFAIDIDSMTSRVEERSDFYRQPIVGDIQNIMRDIGMNFCGDIIWNKSHAPGRKTAIGALGSLRIRRNHESILLFSKGEQFINNETEGKIDLLQKDLDEWTLSVWHFGPEQKHRKACGHPCPFPLELPKRLIKMFSFQGDLVLDCFCGTGTSLEAAKQLNRRYYGIDLNPKYVEYAKKRLQQVK